jgi:lysophospholipase L1-like esterase
MGKKQEIKGETLMNLMCWFKKTLQSIKLKFRGPRVLPPEFLHPRSPHFSDGTEAFTDITEMTTESVVFLGDSMIYFANWSKAYPDIKTSNQGIGGDTTKKVFARLAPILRAKPKSIFMRIGINDLQADMIPCEYQPIYESIVQAIRLYSPQTKLTCMTICPIGKPFESYHYEIQNRINEYNLFIACLCKKYGIGFLNNFALLAGPDGWLREEYYCDGLHLSPEGHQVVFKSISVLL